MKKIVLSLVIIGFVLAGCNHTKKDELERQITVKFTVNHEFSSFLKSTQEDEEALDAVVLFGVDDSGNVIESFSEITGTELGTGKTLTLSPDITSLYAVANYPTQINAATVSELNLLTCDYSVMPTTFFVMTGVESLTFSDEVIIDLERAVAKIEVAGKNGFEVKEVKVNDTPDEGYAFPQKPLNVSSFGTTDYTIIPNGPIYVAENNSENPTTLTVKGTYDGKEYILDVEFIVKNQRVPVERNKLYVISIVPQPAEDYDVNITFEIKEWSLEVVDPQIVEVD